MEHVDEEADVNDGPVRKMTFGGPKVVGEISPNTPKVPAEPLPDPSGPVQKAISVTDLIAMCDAAAARMSHSNHHKLLMMNCGYALKQLVERLHHAEEHIRRLEGSNAG